MLLLNYGIKRVYAVNAMLPPLVKIFFLVRNATALVFADRPDFIPRAARNRRSGECAHKTGVFLRVMRTLLLCLFPFYSCSTLHAGVYLLFTDNYDGKALLENEPQVKKILENAAASFEKYTIKAFSRTGIHFRVKQTELLTHSFYVIVSKDKEYHTLSFYGTEIASYSEGAWAYDTDADRSSYRMYLEGDNKWKVKELFRGHTINTRETLGNIINMIDGSTTYFYKDHILDKPDMNNCNTALYETVALKQNENEEGENGSGVLAHAVRAP